MLYNKWLIKSLCLDSDPNPSMLNGEILAVNKESAIPSTDPGIHEVIEDNSSQITTTNITPEDITSQLDELIEPSAKRVKTE